MKTNATEIFKNLVTRGFAIEKNRVSLAQYDRVGKKYYQVHSDNYKCRESILFKEAEIDSAVAKFIEVLKAVQ